MRGFRALLGGNSFYPTKKLKIFVGVPFRETYPLDSRFKVVAAVENFYFEFCVIERNFCRIVRAYPDSVLLGSHSELRARLRRFSKNLVEFRILKPVVVEKPLFKNTISLRRPIWTAIPELRSQSPQASRGHARTRLFQLSGCICVSNAQAPDLCARRTLL